MCPDLFARPLPVNYSDAVLLLQWQGKTIARIPLVKGMLGGMFSSVDDSEGGNRGAVVGAGNLTEAWAADAASTGPDARVNAGADADAGMFTGDRGSTNIIYATAALQEPLLISVPSGVRVEAVGLMLCVQGVHDGARRDVARLKLGLQYFMNAPLYAVEHIMDRYVCCADCSVICTQPPFSLSPQPTRPPPPRSFN